MRCNYVAADILVCFENALCHDGVKRRSGRYPWGSGDNPYQHEGRFTARVSKLKASGLNDKEIREALGWVDPETGERHPMSTVEFRDMQAIDNMLMTKTRHKQIMTMTEDGKTPTEIAKRLEINESSVREHLNPDYGRKAYELSAVVDYIKDRVDNSKNGIVDVGTFAEDYLSDELNMNISKERLRAATTALELQGYEVGTAKLQQLTNNDLSTTIKYIGKPGTEPADVHKKELDFIVPRKENTEAVRDSDILHPSSFQYPGSLSSKRVQVVYDEEGGSKKDGLIEIRPGCKDISLGGAHYAQVRILVDGTHYLKGMAVYSDDLPDGVDVRFNSNKSKGTPMCGPDDKHTVLKLIETDNPENPFGANIPPNGQTYYTDSKGKRQLGLVNMKSQEGDWSKWATTLSSQSLSKQPKGTIKKQLDLTRSEKENEYEDIKSLTNPTIKKYMLMNFANECDSAAVHLQAAGLPRQRYQVLLPIPSMPDNEIYAPQYKNGEKVVLIRYPYSGAFESPTLTVNNNRRNAQKVFPKDSMDAVGINSHVASILSGADFDGDAVTVIPVNNSAKILSKQPLKGLDGFDPKLAYSRKPGETYKRMKKSAKGNEMGKIANLITDMTLQNASDEEIERAVRHSMVVIDAAKHDLNYKQSYEDNGIAELKRKYQGVYNEKTGKWNTGAATLISRASAQTSVVKRQGSPRINPDGSLYYKEADDIFRQTDHKKPNNKQLERGANGNTDRLWIVTDKSVRQATVKEAKDALSGKKVSGLVFGTSKPHKYMNQDEMAELYEKGDSSVVKRTQKSKKMAEAKDAYELVSTARTPAEMAYADYANSMKALANDARKEYLSTPNMKQDPQAKKQYAKEVESLQAKYRHARMNQPLERKAQSVANIRVSSMVASNPELKENNKALKKIKDQELKRARVLMGAKRTTITITDKEWEAIQAGAISNQKLKDMLKYIDVDSLAEKAMPRDGMVLTPSKKAMIKARVNSGYTIAEIAESMNLSPTTVSKALE